MRSSLHSCPDAIRLVRLFFYGYKFVLYLPPAVPPVRVSPGKERSGPIGQMPSLSFLPLFVIDTSPIEPLLRITSAQLSRPLNCHAKE